MAASTGAVEKTPVQPRWGSALTQRPATAVATDGVPPHPKVRTRGRGIERRGEGATRGGGVWCDGEQGLGYATEVYGCVFPYVGYGCTGMGTCLSVDSLYVSGFLARPARIQL